MNEEELEPKITPQFWFDLSKNLVEGVPEKINSSVEQFEKLTIWLWGIYTPLVGIGTSAVGILGNFFPSVWTMLLILIPCFSLLFSYWFLSKARSSVIVSFHADDYFNIKQEYENMIKTKNFYFSLAQKITLVTCALIPISIFSYYLDKIVFFAKPNFVVKVLEEPKKVSVSISGFFPLVDEEELIHLKVTADEKEISLPFSAFLNPKQKVIYLELELPEKTQEVKASLEWKASREEKRILSKFVQLR